MLESLFFWSYEYMDNAWIGVDIKMTPSPVSHTKYNAMCHTGL